MLNQYVIIGRIKDLSKEDTITVAIPRNFKNEYGVYETDYIDVELRGEVNKKTHEYCEEGDVIGVKGRIVSNGKGMKVVGDKVTFLTTRRDDSDEPTEE